MVKLKKRKLARQNDSLWETPKRPYRSMYPGAGEGTLRNKPCRCGSGLKYKKCCLA